MRSTLLLVLNICLFTICGDAIERQKLHSELVKLEASYLAKWDKMKVVFKDKALNYEARQMWEGDTPLTIIKYKAANLKVEQFRNFFNDPVPA